MISFSLSLFSSLFINSDKYRTIQTQIIFHNYKGMMNFNL